MSIGVFSDIAEAMLVANAAIGLIYGRCMRLLDNKPFDEAQLERIVAESAGISKKGLWRLLSRTWNQGDALSAKLRRRLKKIYD